MKKNVNTHQIIALALAVMIGINNIPSIAFASENSTDVNNQETVNDSQQVEEETSENREETVQEENDNENKDNASEDNETTKEEEENKDTASEDNETVDDKNTDEDTDENKDTTSEDNETTKEEEENKDTASEDNETVDEKIEDSNNNEVTYKITFVGMNDMEISTQEVKDVSEIELPEAPEVEGYTFVKWDIDLENLELTEDIIVKAVYEEIEEKLEHKVLVTTIDNKEISIIGNMPANADVLVKKVVYTKDIEKNIENALDGEVTITVYEAFDIKIKVGDKEYQPNQFDETVTVSIKNIEVEEKDEEELKVFHIDNSDTVEEISADIDSDKAEFEADSFSVYVVAGVSYNTEDGELLENDYATAYLFEDGTLLVTEFKKDGDYYYSYPWNVERNNIKTLKFADGITFIGDHAFDNYFTGITGNLVIPDSVTTIGRSAFYGCTGFDGTLTIPNSVTTIEYQAFYKCGFTGDLVIPDSVTTIGDHAFKGCGFTGDLVIPDSVTTIGRSVFYGCTGFDGTLTLPNSITSIGNSAFYKCGFTGDLVIPDSVTTIGCNAFDSCNFTGTLTIPNSVTTIDGSVFSNSGFTGDLVIPDSVTTIGDYAFKGCGFTGDLVIPDSVTTIGRSAFSYCYGFNGTLTLPNSITSIEYGTFEYCYNFTGDLVIPSSVTTIDMAAFRSCYGFDGTLTLPNSITSIGNSAFIDCYNINNLIINSIFEYESGFFHIVYPYNKIHTTSNWDEIRGTTEWETVARGWNRWDKKYSVTFETNGGTNIEEQTLEEGEMAIEPEQPTKENHRFIGWYKESTFENVWNFDEETVNDDVIIYVKWEKYPEVTLMDGDTVHSTVTTKYNSNTTASYNGYWLEEPDALTKEGYTFKGWSLTSDGDVISFNKKPSSFYKDTSDISLNSEYTVPLYKITEDITLYAKWEKIPVVTLMDGDTVYSKVTTKYNSHPKSGYNGYWLEEPESLTREGYTITGWSLTKGGEAIKFNQYPTQYYKDTSDVNINNVVGGGDDTVPIYRITEDTILYAVWQKTPIISLMDNDTIISTIMTKYNNYAYVGTYRGFWLEKPEDYVKDGYRFLGWSYTNGGSIVYPKDYPDEYFMASSDISLNGTRTVKLFGKFESDTNLYAVLDKIPVVTLKDGDTVISEVLTKYNSNYFSEGYWLEKPEAPEKEGHTFKGWSLTPNGDIIEFNKLDADQFRNLSDITLDGNKTVPIIKITSDTTLYAIYEISKYQVTFNSDGGSFVPAQTVEYNNQVNKPVDPTKKGYTFTGWFKEDDTEFDFSTPIKSALVLKAKWDIKKYTVSFDTDTDEEIPDQKVEHGKPVVKPDDPEKEGEKFIGWYPEGDPDTPYDFDEPVEKEIKLIAKWEKEKYQVTFDSNGGSSVPAQTIEHGDKAKKPVDPSKEGYQLKCWLTEDNKEFSFDTPIKGNTKLIAEWEIKKYTVSFDSNGGSSVPNQNVEHNSKAVKPADPTREGARFLYWYEDKTDVSFDFDNTPIKKETKLIAKWEINKYEVTFDSNGGSEVPKQEVEHGSKAKKPVNPTKPDYKFVGWYTEDDTPFDFDNTPIKEKIKLIAKWEEIIYKTVKFVTNNEQTLDDVKVEQGTPVNKPTGLTKAGYEIEGWYVDSEFTQKWNFNDNVNEDITLYAKWIKKKVEDKPSPKPTPPSDEPKPTPPSDEPEPTPPSDEPKPTPPSENPEPTPDKEVDRLPDLIPPKPITVTKSEDTAESVKTPDNQKHVINAGDEVYMGGLDDDSENMKSTMARFVEVVKKLAIVVSISALAILGILALLLLIIAWLKRVKVLNDCNTDEYQEEDFQVVYKTRVKSEGNKVAELFKREDRVWTLTIPENIINERITDAFEIELKKHFCKKYNGEQIMVILDNEDEEQRISLGFVIDKEDNIIAFNYNEKEENA